MATPTLTRHRLPGVLGEILVDVRAGGRESPRPAVVVVHGFKGFKDWGLWPPFAERLARAGFTAVTFNLSGSGVDDTGEFVFPERFGHNTFSAELQDLRRVVDALAAGELGVAPPTRLGLLGHSRGGGIAVLQAAADRRVRALVTWAAISTVERWPAAQRDGVARRGGERGEERPHRPDPAASIPTCSTTSSATPRRSTSRRPPARSRCRGSSCTAPRTRRCRCARASGSPRRRPAAPLPRRSTGAGHTFGAAHPWRGATPELERVEDATLAFFAGELR